MESCDVDETNVLWEMGERKAANERDKLGQTVPFVLSFLIGGCLVLLPLCMLSHLSVDPCHIADALKAVT